MLIFLVISFIARFRSRPRHSREESECVYLFQYNTDLQRTDRQTDIKYHRKDVIKQSEGYVT